MWHYLLVSLLLLILCIIVFVGVYMKRESFTHHVVSDLFLQNLDRHMDPVFEKFYEKKSMNFIRQDVNRYRQQVREGQDYMKHSKVVVTGLIRNCMEQVPRLQEFFESFQQMCQQCVILLVENDSADDTRQRLYEWSQRNSSVIILCPNRSTINDMTCQTRDHFKTTLSKSPSMMRIKRMAVLRNTYLRYIETHYSHFDVALVMDMDLDGKLFMDGVFHTMSMLHQKPYIDAIACNGLLRTKDTFIYYDSFAYIPLNEDIEWHTLFDKHSHDIEVGRYVTQRYLNGKRPLELDRVRSAFGGACVYRVSSIVGKSYGYSQTGFACEHSYLNRRLKHVYVNPRMVFLIETNPD